MFMARTYPTEWDKFCKIINTSVGFTHYTHKLKSNVFIEDLNRFAARYAVAEDFQGIDIKNSTTDTKLGYEALMRSLLVWSTVESYFNIFITNTNSHYTCLSYTPVEKSNIKIQLDAIGADMNQFYSFILLNCNSDHQDNINYFLIGQDYNPTMLLSAIRHVFGHGELSANVNNVSPRSINKIVNILKSEILKKIDDSFTLLVKNHPNYSNV